MEKIFTQKEGIIMGYRSEVAIVIKKEDLSKMLSAIAEYDKTEYDEVWHNDIESASKMLEYADKKEIGDYVVYHWENIKWYYSYKSVQFFAMMKSKYGIASDFIRIGENAGDIGKNMCLESGIIYPMVEQHIQIDE